MIGGDALRVLGPGEVDERLLLQARLVVGVGPLAPARELLGLRQELDVQDLLVDLLLGHRLRLAVDAEDDEDDRPDDQEQADDDGDGLERTALEIAVVGGERGPFMARARYRKARRRGGRKVVRTFP